MLCVCLALSLRLRFWSSKMSKTPELKVVELSRVSPPPGSVQEASITLNLFDVFWLQFPPIQRLFFYQLSPSSTCTTSHFLQSLLPNLKHSLSLALQLFYPLAGTLQPSPDDPFIRYVDGDSVSLTIAESPADFHQLISNHEKDAQQLHPFAPDQLHNSDLLALHVTVFPNYSGIAIGLTFHHIAADGLSLAHFMKSWSSINRSGGLSLISSLPIHDRTIVEDPKGLKKIFLDQMKQLHFGKNIEKLDVKTTENPVRATFVLKRSDIENLKNQVRSRADLTRENARPPSTFAAVCGYAWVCLTKARGYLEEEPLYFTFAADCRRRLDPPLPENYFGNCIAGTLAVELGNKLAGENGIRIAIEAIGRAIEGLKDGPLRDAENWIPNYTSLASKRILSVAGSPRFRVYEMDFGWGRPTKTEVISIDRSGAIYVGDSRDEEGGIELGFSMPGSEMSIFSSVFEEGLRSIR